MALLVKIEVDLLQEITDMMHQVLMEENRAQLKNHQQYQPIHLMKIVIRTSILLSRVDYLHTINDYYEN